MWAGHAAIVSPVECGGIRENPHQARA